LAAVLETSEKIEHAVSKLLAGGDFSPAARRGTDP
jgi:hypothetical protein